MVYPQGWDSPDKRAILAKRRLYYEVKLHEWFVRHDLDGDGMLLKSVLSKGEGYDRPDEIDEITLDIKVYQLNRSREERIFQDV